MTGSTDALAEAIRSGDRTELSRAITLVESTRPDRREQAQKLLLRLLPDAGHALHVGITGVPGVGKSTAIEALGTMLTDQGHRVAVLAVDPSSTRTGGSILGDKTRMARLAVHPDAYVRPSPTSGTLGGVAKTTRETIVLLEAAGFDVILVETVGIGQSETAVADMTDFFLLLMLAGAGDELQGLKKGVIELADMIAVNKADGDNVKRAHAAAAEYSGALHILTPRSPHWTPPVITYSALTGNGLAELWAQILAHRQRLTQAGEFAARRKEQQVKWLWTMLDERLIVRLKSDPALKSRLPALERAVAEGRLSPALAVEEIAHAMGL